ncbi:MAG: ABC transporter ATP-binding protein [Thermotogae bacterium]|uniref:ABC transporter ATP-binding protein n=1 Tax=Kosmotoga sp. TaxID=1955248 RepID=UPI000F2B33B2|nr:ABC transporter ATP-binding protein [Kosmotoga sp.]MBO8166530.1 ABC transporter ATP-binding protein [Kosmotoga sp.]RKX47183.1 MAG: ABC transporter ATP-binding protein [Thermotogota bacterium]
MSYALTTENIKKVFKKNKKTIHALKGIDLQIREGEIYGLLGPNGSGKSTFIRIASTLLIPDAGKIEIFGYDVVKKASKVQRLINRVSVEASFFRKLSAIENLLFAAGIHGISKKEALKKIYAISEKVGLDKGRLHDPLEDFSRGMQQKVAIARAFMTEPKLMLLDEPTTGLDPRAKREVQSLILHMKEKMGATILLTTHDMEEAERLCDYVAIIHKGRIIVKGHTEKLKAMIAHKIKNPTFEDVFMEFTGVSFDEAEYEEAESA